MRRAPAALAFAAAMWMLPADSYGGAILADAAPANLAAPERELREFMLQSDRHVRAYEATFHVTQQVTPEWIRYLEQQGVIAGETSDLGAPPDSFLLRTDGTRFFLRRIEEISPGHVDKSTIAFDGAIARTYDDQCRCGNLHRSWPLGNHFTPEDVTFSTESFGRTLRQVLQNGTFRIRSAGGAHSSDSSRYEIEFSADDPGSPSTPDTSEAWRRVSRITIDGSRSFLPTRIWHGYVWGGTTPGEDCSEEFEVTEFIRTPGQQWFPSKGLRRTFGTVIDASNEAVNGLWSTEELVVDSIRWDLEHDSSNYTIVYPTGTRVLDTTTNDTYIAGGVTETGIIEMLRQFGADTPLESPEPGPAVTSNISASTVSDNCGPVALYTVCAIHGKQTTLDDLARLSDTDSTGTTMLGIVRAARALGLHANGVRMTPDELFRWRSPSIVYLDFPPKPHFLVAWPVSDSAAWVLDYPAPPRVLLRDRLTQGTWSGEAVLFDEAPPFAFPPAVESVALAAGQHEGSTVAGDDAWLRFAQPSARVVVEPTVKTVRHRFEFDHVGPRTLDIEEITRSCTCSDVTCSNPTPEPGDHGFIEVVVERGSERSRDVMLQVHSTDPVRPTATLSLSIVSSESESSEVSLIDVESPSIDFGMVNETAGATLTTRLIRKGENPEFQIETVKSSHASVLAREVPANLSGTRVSVAEPTASRTIEIRLAPPLKTGVLDATVSVTTTPSSPSPAVIRVTGFVYESGS